MNIKVSRKTKDKLVAVIDSINMLDSIKSHITSELTSKGISSDKVNTILNKEKTITILNADEKYNFFKVIYNFSHDEAFNPDNMLVQDSSTGLDFSSLIDEANSDETLKSLYTFGSGVKSLTSATNNKNTDEEEAPKKDQMPELFFDYDFKLKFASQYPAETKRVIMALFRKSKGMEDKLEKDLCNFNIKELTEFFKSLKSATVRSLQNSTSTVEKYVDWAQLPENREGKTDLKVNYATAFDTKEKLEKLVDKEKENSMIVSREELFRTAMDTPNAQDGVIIALLTDGVSHKNEFEELIELTIDDVDRPNKVVHLADRDVPISMETSILIKRAYEQEKYVSINEKTNTSRKYKIAEGLNILRGLRGKAKVKAQIISQRLLRIKDEFANPYINATAISYSGQVHRVNDFLEEGFSIESAVEKTLKQFGVPNNETSRFYLKERVEKYNQLLKSKNK